MKIGDNMDFQTLRIISVSVNVVCLIITFLLSLLYFSKRKITTNENSVYDALIICNFICLFLELIFYLTTFTNSNELYVSTITKVYFASNSVWMFLHSIYIFIITDFAKKMKEKWDFSKKKRIISLSVFIIILLVMVLPMQNIYEGKYFISSTGPSIAFVFLLCFGLTFLNIILVITARRKIKKSKVIPLIVFILIIFAQLAANAFGFELLLMTFPMTLVCFLMYHTIENPDAQMINELYKNKLLVEKSYEEKSNFLFKMTQEVKKPINNMKSIINSLKETDNANELKQGIKLLDANSKQMDFIVNDVLDITTLDSRNIKIMNNRYNVYNLFRDIEKRMQEYASDSVEFRFNIDENIPYLYGDSIKLKQIIMSVLLNSIKKTKSGFIELSIEAITKYDVCRLIIEVEDSGVGMSIDKVNDVLITTSELSVDDISNLEKLDINLKLCQKSIKLLGGNLMIRSEEGKGTEVIITIDQHIYEKKENNELDKYEDAIYNASKILVVSDKEEDVNKIKKIINDDSIIISSSFYGQDAIMKIKSGKNYDLIIIEDELPIKSGLETLKELQKLDDFKMPVVVMLDKNKENIKEHYIKDGFSDYILKDSTNEEIKRIFNKYC